MNLLDIKPIKSLYTAKWFPLVFQLMTLVVFILLILGGLGVTTGDSDVNQWLRNTNLANLVVWSLWWPLIIISAVLLGRVWCTICPMELLTYWAGLIGLKQPVPSFLKSGWGVTIFYALIWIIGMQILAINRNPHQMSLYLLLLMLLAVDISLIFEKRAFCSYLCPVGHLLGLYALLSPLEWRAQDTSLCKTCKTKDCVTQKNRDRLSGRSCTSRLYPASLKDNRHCLLCTQCLKACPNDNLRWSIRPPMADLLTNIDLRPAQIGFILILSGFVVYEILGEWTVSYKAVMWLPWQITDALGLTGMIANATATTLMFVLLPILILRLVDTLAQWISSKQVSSFKDTAQTLVLLLLPTIAAAHLIKSLLKTTSRLPYWPGALIDPKGIETAQALASGTRTLNESLVQTLDPAVTWTAITLLLLALAATLRLFRKSESIQPHSPGTRGVLLFTVLVYWGIFATTLVGWRF